MDHAEQAKASSSLMELGLLLIVLGIIIALLVNQPIGVLLIVVGVILLIVPELHIHR